MCEQHSPWIAAIASRDPHKLSNHLIVVSNSLDAALGPVDYNPILPLLLLLQRCDGASQLLYSIQFNTIRANEKSRNCIWTAICLSDSSKNVPAGIGMNSLRVFFLCPPPVSLVAPQMCQTSDGMRHGITPPIGIIFWSVLNLLSLKVSVLVRCGENDKGGYSDNSVTKSTPF